MLTALARNFRFHDELVSPHSHRASLIGEVSRTQRECVICRSNENSFVQNIFLIEEHLSSIILKMSTSSRLRDVGVVLRQTSVQVSSTQNVLQRIAVSSRALALCTHVAARSRKGLSNCISQSQISVVFHSRQSVWSLEHCNSVRSFSTDMEKTKTPSEQVNEILSCPDRGDCAIDGLTPEVKRSIGLKWASLALEKEFEKADIDKSGTLTLEEFQGWAKAMIKEHQQYDMEFEQAVYCHSVISCSGRFEVGSCSFDC